MSLIYLLPLTSLLGFAFFLKRIAKMPTAFTFFSSNAIVLLSLYIAGLGGFLSETANVLLVLGMLAMLYCILTMFKKKAYCEYFTPLNALFILSILFIFMINWNRTFIYWDEFSFWAFGPREIIRANALPTPENSTLSILSYLPGAPLFIYYFCRFDINREGLFYIAQSYLCISILLVFFRNDKWKSWKQILSLHIVLNIILHAFINSSTSPYTTLYVDSLLGLTFGAFLYTAYHKNHKSSFNENLVLFLLIAMMMLEKHIGIAFALIAIINLFINNLVEKVSVKKLIVEVGIYAVVISSIYFSWKWYIEKNEITRVFTSHEAFSWKSLFQSEKILMFYQNYLKAFFLKRLTSGSFLSLKFSPFFLIVLFLVVIFINYFTNRKEYEKKWLYSNGTIFLGCTSYFLLLGYTYLYMFSDFERGLLASYERYVGTYFFGWALLIIPLTYNNSRHILNLKNKYIKRTYIVLIAIFLLNAKNLVRLTVRMEKKPNNMLPLVNDARNCAKELNKLLGGKPKKIFSVWQQSTGAQYFVFKMYISPHVVQREWVSWSFGKPYPYFETRNYNDVWTRNLSLADLKKQLAEFDYILLGNADENFWHHYGSLFQEREKGLYEINKNNGDIKTSIIKKS